MITSLMTFIRRHVLMFGVVKFCAGLVIGFGLGVCSLPILTAEKGLDTATIEALSQRAFSEGIFVRDLPGSDMLHWGEGVIMANADHIWLDGEISPGPDYRLYLLPKYVETGAEFLQIKAAPRKSGRLKRLKIFLLDIPANVEVTNFPAVLILC